MSLLTNSATRSMPRPRNIENVLAERLRHIQGGSLFLVNRPRNRVKATKYWITVVCSNALPKSGSRPSVEQQIKNERYRQTSYMVIIHHVILKILQHARFTFERMPLFTTLEIIQQTEIQMGRATQRLIFQDRTIPLMALPVMSITNTSRRM